MSLTFSGPHGETISPSPVVHTHLGPIQGLIVDDVHRYLGIRYAAAPVGRLRFKPPVDPAPWRDVQEAIHYGAPAIQGIRGPETAPTSDFALTQLVSMPVGGHVKVNNEDCLYLNVWTPGTDDGKRPVLVWFHGGGFAYGAGSEPMYEGTRLARRGDAVIVTVNHRLNLFGYMNLTGTHPHYADAVNVGALDLIHALKWVKQNIGLFGGDPENVTIAGESGGGAKVNDMLAMPAAQGLFHKAIIQSGARPDVHEGDQTRADSLAILRSAGVEDITPERLATILPHELLNAGLVEFTDEGPGTAQFRDARSLTEDLAQRLGNTVDGSVLPAHPFIDGPPEFASEVPAMIGWTKDEWNLMLVEREPDFVNMTEQELNEGATRLFGASAPEIVAAFKHAFPGYSPGHLSSALVTVGAIRRFKEIADLKAQDPAPVYCYQLCWESPVNEGIYRASHALDLPLMFDNVENARSFVGPGTAPQRVADQMADAWLAFMRNGSPNHPGIPEWEPWSADTRATLMFDVESVVENNPYGDLDELMSRAE
ncbi:carboxylesterase family protein [Leucobacter allii]|uniref:carboxylesterase/lipase family protein n=1 Tax=Leucobacter allii TaxID=2932247 RepID=UPI001FD2D5E6|nr:carboxylesterase family protein [Leucobacter allii]UOR02379.1 carboxylesterase family protein [Leucobacter allii]